MGNDPKTVALDVDSYLMHLAQLRSIGAHQEANAVQALAGLFTPPLRIDERRIERMIAALRSTQEE